MRFSNGASLRHNASFCPDVTPFSHGDTKRYSEEPKQRMSPTRKPLGSMARKSKVSSLLFRHMAGWGGIESSNPPTRVQLPTRSTTTSPRTRVSMTLFREVKSQRHPRVQGGDQRPPRPGSEESVPNRRRLCAALESVPLRDPAGVVAVLGGLRAAKREVQEMS